MEEVMKYEINFLILFLVFKSFRIDNVVAHNGKEDPTEIEMVNGG